VALDTTKSQTKKPTASNAPQLLLVIPLKNVVAPRVDGVKNGNPKKLIASHVSPRLLALSSETSFQG
jgi:hypothetical protein